MVLVGMATVSPRYGLLTYPVPLKVPGPPLLVGLEFIFQAGGHYLTYGIQ